MFNTGASPSPEVSGQPRQVTVGAPDRPAGHPQREVTGDSRRGGAARGLHQAGLGRCQWGLPDCPTGLPTDQPSLVARSRDPIQAQILCIRPLVFLIIIVIKIST